MRTIISTYQRHDDDRQRRQLRGKRAVGYVEILLIIIIIIISVYVSYMYVYVTYNVAYKCER